MLGVDGALPVGLSRIREGTIMEQIPRASDHPGSEDVYISVSDNDLYGSVRNVTG